MRELEMLLDGGTFYEAARWHEGRWWVSDFYDDRVLAIDPDGTVELVGTLEQPAGLGWLPDGSLLVVSMTGHKLWRHDGNGGFTEHADISAHMGGQANDMVVDAEGRAYVGNFGYDLAADEHPKETVVVRVDPDGSVTPAADGLQFPNGMVLSEDGGTLIVAETIAGRLTAFDVASDGALGGRRVWAQLGPAPPLAPGAEMLPQVEFAPDGICLDAEGCIWAGDSLHQRAARIAPGGEILEEIPAPGDLAFYGVMLGGEDGKTLLLCGAPDWRETRPEGERASVVFTTRVEVGRAGRP